MGTNCCSTKGSILETHKKRNTFKKSKMVRDENKSIVTSLAPERRLSQKPIDTDETLGTNASIVSRPTPVEKSEVIMAIEKKASTMSAQDGSLLDDHDGDTLKRSTLLLSKHENDRPSIEPDPEQNWMNDETLTINQKVAKLLRSLPTINSERS